jgi:hypothetical protein
VNKKKNTGYFDPKIALKPSYEIALVKTAFQKYCEKMLSKRSSKDNFDNYQKC